MAFIGRQSGNIGNYVRCNTITPDGSTTTFALTNVLDNTTVAHWNRKQCDMFSIRSYSVQVQHSVLTEQILSSQQS